MANRRLTALVTGASYGIGRELALACARAGHDLVLVARSQDRLEGLAREIEKGFPVKTRVFEADLSDAGTRKRVVDTLAREGVPVDILINNAGFGSSGPFKDADLSNELNMIELNVTALTHLTGLFLPGMLMRNRGRVLNVASTAGFQPGPLMAVYYATKAYVLHFSEAIAEELAGTGVTVTALCPGPTLTEFQARSGLQGARLLRIGTMDAKTVAEVGYRAMMDGRVVAIAGLRNWMLAQSVRFAPRALVRKIAKTLNTGAR